MVGQIDDPLRQAHCLGRTADVRALRRGQDPGEIDKGRRKVWIEFERASIVGNGGVHLLPGRQERGQAAVRRRVIRLEIERTLIVLQGRIGVSEGRERASEVVTRPPGSLQKS